MPGKGQSSVLEAVIFLLEKRRHTLADREATFHLCVEERFELNERNKTAWRTNRKGSGMEAKKEEKTRGRSEMGWHKRIPGSVINCTVGIKIIVTN